MVVNSKFVDRRNKLFESGCSLLEGPDSNGVSLAMAQNIRAQKTGGKKLAWLTRDGLHPRLQFLIFDCEDSLLKKILANDAADDKD